MTRMTRFAAPLLTASALALVPCAADARTGSITIRSIAADGATITVKGTARVSSLSTAGRRAARVVLSFTDAAGAVERFRVRPGSTGSFRATRTTKLTGPLTLRARLRVPHRTSGPLLTRRAAVTIAGDGAPQKLVGTFRLDAGRDVPGGAPAGTYFQMLTPGGPPLDNPSSASAKKAITLLSPGTDGGLRTDAFQAPPSPAFAGGSSGDALANRIIQPQRFFGTGFSIVTAATDAQTGATDPLPEIVATGGVLSGQVTAWVAQWNGQSFNQGTPKPDGSTPGATTPLTGTYDPATRHFVLTWKSLIVGGPFNSFVGAWHLEGTFVPVTAPPKLLPL